MPAKISKHARYQVNGTITLDQELRPSLNNCSSIITQAPQSMIQGSLNSMTNAKENWQHCCVQGLSNLQRIKLSSLNTGLGSATCRQVKVENPNKSLSAGYNLCKLLIHETRRTDTVAHCYPQGCWHKHICKHIMSLQVHLRNLLLTTTTHPPTKYR